MKKKPIPDVNAVWAVVRVVEPRGRGGGVLNLNLGRGFHRDI